MAGRNKSAKEKIEEWNQFVNDAANVGIDEIIKQHPVFSDNRNYIIRHIDKRKLMTTAREINYELSFKKWDERKKSEYLHAAIASAVSTGTLFDDEGKEIILKKSLEEKAGRGFFRGLFARRTLEGEKYLDQSIGAFQNLYHMFKEGDYAEKMPRVYEAVDRVYTLGMLDPAFDILKYHKMIDDKTYKALKKRIVEETKESHKKVIGGLESYLKPKEEAEKEVMREAATVFVVLGIVLTIFSGLKLTGAAINPLVVGSSLGGLLLLVFGLILFFVRLKRNKFKN